MRNEGKDPDPLAESSDVALAQLRRAQPRLDPDAQARARVLLRVQAAFEAQLRARRQRSRRFGFAMAAAVALCVTSAALLEGILSRPLAPSAVARQFTVDALHGEVRVVDSEANEPQIAEAGTRIRAGQRIHSAPSASVSLRSADGLRVRLSGGSELRFRSDGAFALEHGRVYLDTDAARTPAEKHVLLRVGDAQIENQGTRFSVSVQGTALAIAVRSGSVSWAEGRDRATVQARERLQIAAGRVIARTQLEDLDAEFAWTLAAAAFPPPGTAMTEVLAWYADETGQALLLAPGVDRLLSQRIEGVSQAPEPRLRVQALLAASGLTMRETAAGISVECVDRRDCG